VQRRIDVDWGYFSAGKDDSTTNFFVYGSEDKRQKKAKPQSAQSKPQRYAKQASLRKPLRVIPATYCA